MFWMFYVPRFWFNFLMMIWVNGSLAKFRERWGRSNQVPHTELFKTFTRILRYTFKQQWLTFRLDQWPGLYFTYCRTKKKPKKSYFNLKKYSFDVATKSNWKFTYQFFKFIISYLRISWFSFRASSVYVMFVVLRWNDAQLPSTYD